MKNTRVWITLTAGLASGLLAGYLALVYVSEEPAPLQANEPVGTQIVVASRDLPLGTILTREDVEIVAWPSRNTPEGFDLPPRVVPHPMLVPAPVEGREGRASSGTRATA